MRSRPRADSRWRSRTPCCRAVRSRPAGSSGRARSRGRWRRSRRGRRRPRAAGAAQHHRAAENHADEAMPISVPGSGTPMRPSMPPRAMTMGKATGSSQIAGAPELRAPQSHRDHGHDMIEAGDRMPKADEETRSFRPCARAPARPARSTAARTAAAAARRAGFACAPHCAPPSRIATRWMVQNAPERADGVSRAAPAPSAASGSQGCERIAPEQHQQHEAQLSDLDANVEPQQRERQFTLAAGPRSSGRWRSRSRAAARKQRPPPRDAGW